MVSGAYGGAAEATLKYAPLVPKHDPMPLAAIIAAATSKFGVVATMSALAYPPFMLARLSSILDHIAGGRVDWNIVQWRGYRRTEFRAGQAAAARDPLCHGGRTSRPRTRIICRPREADHRRQGAHV
jgi:alkanesulfonate monooxygenase SsuD/methylene tetrahydromethanopterin reductase-like flavin-dependent oxidoreductase (luciferase family)